MNNLSQCKSRNEGIIKKEASRLKFLYKNPEDTCNVMVKSFLNKNKNRTYEYKDNFISRKILYLQSNYPTRENCEKFDREMRLLGEGSAGSAYDTGDFILKTVDFSFNNSVTAFVTFLNESFILEYLTNKKCNFCPKYVEHWYCSKENKGYLLMKKIKNSVTYGDYIKENGIKKESIIKYLIEILDKLHDYQVYHLDPHPYNFLIDTTTMKLYIIDFGSAACTLEPWIWNLSPASIMSPKLIKNIDILDNVACYVQCRVENSLIKRNFPFGKLTDIFIVTFYYINSITWSHLKDPNEQIVSEEEAEEAEGILETNGDEFDLTKYGVTDFIMEDNA